MLRKKLEISILKRIEYITDNFERIDTDENCAYVASILDMASSSIKKNIRKDDE